MNQNKCIYPHIDVPTELASKCLMVKQHGTVSHFKHICKWSKLFP